MALPSSPEQMMQWLLLIIAVALLIREDRCRDCPYNRPGHDGGGFRGGEPPEDRAPPPEKGGGVPDRDP